MIGGPRCVAGLDVGSTKSCAVILEVGWPEGNGNGDGHPPTPGGRVLGVGTAPNEGMRRETVTNLEATTASIRDALREAELTAEREVDGLFVGMASSGVALGSSTGVVALGSREVTGSDVERVHEVARAVVVPTDRQLLHVIPRDYAVDGRSGIQAPAGMSGTRLEVEACIVTAEASACEVLRKAVDRAGYRTEELVLGPLATGLAVLTEREREIGVALVEVGGAATDLAVFRDGRLHRVSSFPWGAGAVTNDVVKGLGVPLEEAERLKREHGSARSRDVDPGESVEVPGPSPGTVRRVSRELLAHIIEQRMDEIFGLVYEDLDRAALLGELGGGVVLTGGGVRLSGTLELAQHVFNLPVRQGAGGRGLSGLVEAVREPGATMALGLALYGGMRGRGGFGGRTVRAITRMTEWLRDFF